MYEAAWTDDTVKRPGKDPPSRQNSAYTQDYPYSQGSQSGGVSSIFKFPESPCFCLQLNFAAQDGGRLRGNLPWLGSI